MTFVVPAVVARRKRLLSEFEKNGAVCEAKAADIQEMYDNWQIRVFKPLRMRALRLDTRFLCNRGKLVETADGKYYLSADK